MTSGGSPSSMQTQEQPWAILERFCAPPPAASSSRTPNGSGLGATMRVLFTGLVLFSITGVRTTAVAQSSDTRRSSAPRDAATAVAVGEGDPWRLQASGTSQNLYGVSFVDSSTGWVVGGAGTILHT